MSYSEEYKEHIEYTFAAFCKVVLRNAAINAYRDLRRKQEHEISLDYLIFEQYDTPTVFVVKGKKVIVGSKWLADALRRLSEQWRTVLLMYFFLHYTDTQFGKEYGRCRSYWKLAALKQLRKEWKKTEHEE